MDRLLRYTEMTAFPLIDQARCYRHQTERSMLSPQMCPFIRSWSKSVIYWGYHSHWHCAFQQPILNLLTLC